MRADGVVDLFPMPEFAIEFFRFQGASGDLVELLGVGAVGAFDGTVEFGRARREHEQVQAALLASKFKLGGKLAAAIWPLCPVSCVFSKLKLTLLVAT